MKKIDLGQTIAILANVGVIAGIVFLAFELRQNNQLMRVDAINSLNDMRIARSELTASHPHMITAEVKNRRSEVLTEEELFVIRQVYVRSHLGWQREYLLFQEGILDEELFRSSFPTMKSLMLRTEPSFSGRQHWDEVWADNAAPAYRRFVELCIIDDCEEIQK